MLSVTSEQLNRLIAVGEEMSKHLQSFVKEIEDRGDAGDDDLIGNLKAAIDSFDSIRVEIEVF